MKTQFTWEPDLWCNIPRWLSSPDTTVIETLCRSHLQLPAHCQVAVTFLAEGALNKLYTIAISDRGGSGSDPDPLRYVFRASFPAEPFYKTASEVATYSYLREHTTIPVPRIIAHSSSAENELGCEWILMEEVPGVPLESVWKDIDLETKKIPSKLIADFWRQLQEQRFSAIGNLYFRKDIDAFNGAVRVLPTKDEKYVLGPIVTIYLFEGGRKIRLPRNLGPYSNDEEYMTALADSEREDMKLLLSADARSLHDFDEELYEDAEDIVKLLNKLQLISAALFPSRPRDFSLFHPDLSLDNILVDPATYEITGIVDWECVGTRPHWEDKYPQFLLTHGCECPDSEVKPLSPGDTDGVRVAHWRNWERRQLRPVFDRELGGECDTDDGKDDVRRGFRQQLDTLYYSQGMVENWIKTNAECM